MFKTGQVTINPGDLTIGIPRFYNSSTTTIAIVLPVLHKVEMYVNAINLRIIPIGILQTAVIGNRGCSPAQ